MQKRRWGWPVIGTPMILESGCLRRCPAQGLAANQTTRPGPPLTKSQVSSSVTRPLAMRDRDRIGVVRPSRRQAAGFLRPHPCQHLAAESGRCYSGSRPIADSSRFTSNSVPFTCGTPKAMSRRARIVRQTSAPARSVNSLEGESGLQQDRHLCSFTLRKRVERAADKRPANRRHPLIRTRSSSDPRDQSAAAAAVFVGESCPR